MFFNLKFLFDSVIYGKLDLTILLHHINKLDNTFTQWEKKFLLVYISVFLYLLD